MKKILFFCAAISSAVCVISPENAMAKKSFLQSVQEEVLDPFRIRDESRQQIRDLKDRWSNDLKEGYDGVRQGILGVKQNYWDPVQKFGGDSLKKMGDLKNYVQEGYDGARQRILGFKQNYWDPVQKFGGDSLKKMGDLKNYVQEGYDGARQRILGVKQNYWDPVQKFTLKSLEKMNNLVGSILDGYRNIPYMPRIDRDIPYMPGIDRNDVMGNVEPRVEESIENANENANPLRQDGKRRKRNAGINPSNILPGRTRGAAKKIGSNGSF